MKKTMNYVGIISLVVTVGIVAAITVIGLTNMSVRLAWNDISRVCDDDTITKKLLNCVTTGIIYVMSIVKKEALA